MNKSRIFSLGLFLLFFFFPLKLNAAEVLQVQSSSLIQVGDHNRNYTVRIACFEVNPVYEQEAKRWLKSSLTRRAKVNLKPEGSSDGILLARVVLLEDQLDLSKALYEKGFGSLSCENT